MAIRLSAQREDRRRRRLREDRTAVADDNDSPAPGRKPKLAPTYTDAAVEAQPRICDLIPIRPRALLLALMTCLFAVMAVEGLHWYAAGQPEWLGGISLDGLNVGASRSLATWLSSTLLLLCSVKSLLILNFRRHKVDDYRGRYGIWGWAACFFMLASMDATAGFHRVVQSACITLTGNTMLGGGAIWWIGALAIVVVLLGMRVLIDIRGSRAAVMVMVMAMSAYGAAALVRLGVLRLGDPELRVLLQSVLLLMGHTLVLFSLQLFARYVFLDAQGLIADRGGRKTHCEPAKSNDRSRSKGKPRRKDKANSAETRRKAKGREAPAQGGRAAKTAVDGEPVATDPEEEELTILEMLDDHSISKSERRRLRKQLKRLERRAA